MPLITDTGTLAALCRRLRRQPFITVDTEFMREKTFWPRLCLVQAAPGLAEDDGEAIAIDPLAPDLDLEPLFGLMADETVLKVFHAARQDLEIFYNLAGRLPVPVFDTQIAAMVCGFGESVGYERLIEALTGARIDKASQFTDWSLRPLSKRQVTYALSDVTHLRNVYVKLRDTLAANGREGWLSEEMKTLTAPETYSVEPREAWRRIKGRNQKPRVLALLRELAAWREEEAQRRDLPRNWIVRDETLVEIARHAPRTVEDLTRTRGLADRQARGPFGARLLEAVERGDRVPRSEWPTPPKPDVAKASGPLTQLLKVLLRMRCEEAGVAAKMVASAEDVNRIAAVGEDARVPALSGWRWALFGEDAIRLRRGDLALAADGPRIRLVALDGSAMPVARERRNARHTRPDRG